MFTWFLMLESPIRVNTRSSDMVRNQWDPGRKKEEGNGFRSHRDPSKQNRAGMPAGRNGLFSPSGRWLIGSEPARHFFFLSNRVIFYFCIIVLFVLCICIISLNPKRVCTIRSTSFKVASRKSGKLYFLNTKPWNKWGQKTATTLFYLRVEKVNFGKRQIIPAKKGQI